MPSAWDNDTLKGRLLAYERPEEKHLRRKTGYWRMVENRMVRQQLIDEGHDPDHIGFIFKVSNRVSQNHANDATYREISASLLRAAGPAPANLGPFTQEQMFFLAEHFAFANDPVAQDIQRIAAEAVKHVSFSPEIGEDQPIKGDPS